MQQPSLRLSIPALDYGASYGSPFIVVSTIANAIGADFVCNGSNDASQIQLALNVADMAGGGTVYIRRGIYLINTAVTGPSSSNVINVIGEGMDATILKGLGAIDHVFGMQSNCTVSDLTVDGNRQTINGLTAVIPLGGIAIDRMNFIRVKCRNVSPTGMWMFTVWDQTSTFSISELHCTDMVIEGPSNTAMDGMAVTYVDTAYFTNLTLRNMTRSPNFYVANRLFIDGMYVKNIPSFASFVIDSGVVAAYLTNINVDSASAPPILSAAKITVSGGEFASGLTIGSTGATNNPSVEITGSKIANLNIAGVVPSKVLMEGCELIGTSIGGAGIWDSTPAASTLNNIIVNNCYFDLTNVAGTRWIGSLNGTTWNATKLNNNVIVGGNTVYNITKGITFQAQNNLGFNPEILYAQGSVTGATTFSRVNGNVITAAQTGAITVTLTAGNFLGDELTLKIVTGGFTQTWPSNLKLAGGACSMTGTSTLTATWDGTNWIEKARSLNIS